MYSKPFLNTLFGYFEQSDILQVYGVHQKTKAVWDRLAQNQFVEQEATLDQLKTIALLVESKGIAPARQIVESLEGPDDLEEIASQYEDEASALHAEIANKMEKGWAFSYTVCTASSPDALVRQVNQLLATGSYQPIGGVSVAVRQVPSVEVLFSQAMVQVAL